ncbi:MAG TPA: glutamyl-tRNA reductase [Solirubrobacteraceae bacterium]|nr:glutamyl-tRNA reductase [Solirubrobacteraceae bacterium]
MNELLALGISYKTAPLALRERLAFTDERALQLAARLRERLEGEAEAAIEEAVILCTCNRSELYLVCADPVRAEARALSLLAEASQIRPTELAEATYSPRNCDAARHLFRVTAGLESMVLGEAEIQGQVRRAYERAHAAEHTGPLTDRLFTAAIAAGRLVRARTEIGASHLSVPAIAVELASQLLGDLEDRSVVILGAGEMSELTAQALARQGAGTVFVANRHARRARAIAERFGGSVVNLERLPEQLVEADIVLSSTASPHCIVGAEELALVMERRRERPLLMIDIAVPRDIEPGCGELPGVSLYDIDDLKGAVDESRAARAAELPKAEAIIEAELRRFARWLGEADILPTVAALRAQAAEIVAAVVAENAGRFESASEQDLRRVQAMAEAIAGRLLHAPTKTLRSLSGARRHATLALVRELFGLEGEEPSARVGALAPRAHTKQPEGTQQSGALAPVYSLRERRGR